MRKWVSRKRKVSDQHLELAAPGQGREGRIAPESTGIFVARGDGLSEYVQGSLGDLLNRHLVRACMPIAFRDRDDTRALGDEAS